MHTPGRYETSDRRRASTAPVAWTAALAMTIACLAPATPARAGCGCEKPPPELAQVRPNAAWPGTEVTIIDARLAGGEAYLIEFVGADGGRATVSAAAELRRDLADGVRRLHLAVPLPKLPPGPAAVRVRNTAGQVLVAVPDDALTVVPPPLRLGETVGRTLHPGYRAAVGRDGTVYLGLDLTGVRLPRTYRAQALGYPLEFTSQGVAFFNVQGILMQLLDAGMPGLYSVEAAAASGSSDVLGYSRHEFNTYFLQHAERDAHAVVDGHWHADGSRHIDHDRLVIAIAGRLRDGRQPAPGATPAFTMVIDVQTLFHRGLAATSTGAGAAHFDNGARIAALDTRTGESTAAASVSVNGGALVNGSAVVEGDLSAAAVTLVNGGEVTGDLTLTTRPFAYQSVAVPDHLTPLGAVELRNGETRRLAPGSYLASRLLLDGSATLFVDNCDGPVTLYVAGPSPEAQVRLENSGAITTCSAEAEHFALYVAGTAPVTLAGGGAFRGVVYAPRSLLQLVNGGEFVGSFVGHRVLVDGAIVHYDAALRDGARPAAPAAWSAPVPGADAAAPPADDD